MKKYVAAVIMCVFGMGLSACQESNRDQSGGSSLKRSPCGYKDLFPGQSGLGCYVCGSGQYEQKEMPVIQINNKLRKSSDAITIVATRRRSLECEERLSPQNSPSSGSSPLVGRNRNGSYGQSVAPIRHDGIEKLW